jgi:flagellar biosynthesis/type III secretory pathway chaperone
MSAEKLIYTMEKLLKLHKSLFEISQKKTEIVKIGDIEALNQTLKDEQAHVAAITKLEKERQTISSGMIPDMGHPSLSDCISIVRGKEKNRLTELHSELLELISEIKQRNELNQQMIFLSMQFVTFSLNLLAPQLANINYGPNGGKADSYRPSTGLFNTKA